MNSRGLHGVLLVNKPVGMSSARVVSHVKKSLGGPKIGHLGTLDPFASGLLPLCLGEATKAAPWLNLASKRYKGTIALGKRTDTLDRTGTVTEVAPVPEFGPEALRALEQNFSGPMQQLPPAFSAIKKDGVPMYKRARRGETPELEPRPVTIYELELSVLSESSLGFSVHCSKGTYIRSLARDIGDSLGCGACLDSLVRTAFGRFRLADAIDLEALEGGATPLELGDGIIPLSRALGHLRMIDTDSGTAAELRMGRQAACVKLTGPESSETACVTCGSDFVAVVSEKLGRWSLERVFNPQLATRAG